LHGALVVCALCHTAALSAQSRPVTLDNSAAIVPAAASDIQRIRHSTPAAARRTEQILAQIQPGIDRELN
jgi:hypothetical protein